MAPVAPNEAEFTAKDRVRRHLHGALVEGSRVKKHHLIAEAAVVLLDVATGFARPLAWAAARGHLRARAPALQREAHMAIALTARQG